MQNTVPKRDDRYARLLANNLNKTLDELTDTYANAKARNDAALYGAFNRLRDSVHAQVEHMVNVRNEFPPENHPVIDAAVEKGRHALAQVEPVPEHVELSEAALDNFNRRMRATNTASDHNMARNPSLPHPPLRATISADDIRRNAARAPLVPPLRPDENPAPGAAEFTPAFPPLTTTSGAAAAAPTRSTVNDVLEENELINLASKATIIYHPMDLFWISRN